MFPNHLARMLSRNSRTTHTFRRDVRCTSSDGGSNFRISWRSRHPWSNKGEGFGESSCIASDFEVVSVPNGCQISHGSKRISSSVCRNASFSTWGMRFCVPTRRPPGFFYLSILYRNSYSTRLFSLSLSLSISLMYIAHKMEVQYSSKAYYKNIKKTSVKKKRK